MRSAQACIEEFDRGKRYRVSVELQRDPKTGKRRRLSRVVRGTRKEAERVKAELLAAYGSKEVSRRYTVEDYCRLVFLPAKKGEIKTRTYDAYVSRLEGYVYGAFGNSYLDEVTSNRVRIWLGTLPPKVARECRRMLHTVFQAAVYDDLLPANPIARVRPVKVERYEPEVLDVQDIQVYLWHFRDTAIEPVVLLALGCGLRRGEICALNVEDINPSTGTVTVDDTYIRTDGGEILHDTPKSANSFRKVHMPASLLERLLDILPAQGAIMRDATGGRMAPDAITRLYRATQKTLPEGVPRISLKNLRHTSLTLAYDSGVDLLAVSRRAGHSNTKITSDYYVRPKGERDSEAAKVIDEAIKG